MKSKYPILQLLAALTVLLLAACTAPPTAQPAMDETSEATPAPAQEDASDADITIGMMKIVSHPALDSIQAAFLATLAEGGYVVDENVTIIDGNAEGDIATLTTIAQQFVDEGVDLIVTTSTPALQAAYNVTKDMAQPIPIIFNAVTSRRRCAR